MSEDLANVPCKVTGKKPHSGGYVNGYCPVKKKNVGAHVVACEKAHGPKPTPKHTVHHKCFNKECVEPSHLEWRTRSEQNQSENLRPKRKRRKFPDTFVTAVLTDFYVSGDTVREVADRHDLTIGQLGDWIAGYERRARVFSPNSCVRDLSHIVLPGIDNIVAPRRSRSVNTVAL